MKSIFFQLRELAKIKSFESKDHFKAVTLIVTVILCMLTLTSPPCLVLSWCKMLLHRFELKKNGKESLLLVFYRRSTGCLSISEFILRDLHQPTSELPLVHFTSQLLGSAEQLLLDVPRTKRRLGERAFAMATPK